MRTRKLSGVLIKHHKHTEDFAPLRMPPPARVVIPMIQHIGAPCVPTVKPGEMVKVGQVIGDSPAFVSAPIHASVSGKVFAIDDFQLSNGSFTKSVVIDSDGEQAVSETVMKPAVHDAQSFVAAVRQSGLVGLGGAGFPTSVKLNIKDPSSIEQIIINSAECESYITSDLRTMLDQSDFIMQGVKALREYLGIRKIVMGIEDNKPKAISLFKK